ncbi:NACHT domain-containing protein [Sphingomonas sp. JC676]|uniref:NACHT domain-containing protein n=1 Tax=Sphingomonas sp. JC676 TaxID=2768065 RepID=UPI0016581190|nr:NACHT domain-containing protein [Sphingomonas sp. JC676]MBC9033067.1 NACHT domain-containing protein [Sphingomonas sp. JC676]
MPLPGSEIVTGLLSSAIYEGIRAPAHALKAFNQRRSAIIQALEQGEKNNSTESESKIDRAVDDVVRVLGGVKGVFTTTVDDFLKELRRTSVLQELYRSLVAARATDAAFAQFLVVYSTFDGLPFEAEACFKALKTAIDYRIQQSTKDPALAELLTGQNAQTTATLERLELVVHDLKLGVQKYSHDEIHVARLKLARSIEQMHKEISIETQRGLRRVNIKTVIISPRLIDEQPAPAPVELEERGRGDALVDVIRISSTTVVLGDPGGGKSTLVQSLCFDMARAITLAASYDASKLFDKSQLRMPLKIAVRTFEKRWSQDCSYSLIDYLVDELKSSLDDDDHLTSFLVKYLLATGSCFVLFDGLDEILNVSKRREIVSIIERFSSHYPSCASLVTSRIVGYRDAPLNEEYNHYYLSRFNRSEVNSFAEKLIKVVASIPRDEAKMSAANFMKQTVSSAADLRVNPLLLGLMVHIFLERGDVPDSRPEIYKACANLLFTRWDQRRDIIFEHPDDFELMDLFGYLALSIFGDSDAEDGVSQEWLTKNMQDFFFAWYSDKPRAVAAARSLVEFITGRAWVMCDIGPAIYKFTHRTFLEYFVALRIWTESDGISGLIDRLYSKIIAAEWDVVSHLSLQIGTTSGPQSLKASHDLLERLRSHPRSDEEQINFLTFIARSTEYLSLPEQVYRTFIREIVQKLGSSPSRARRSSLNVIEILLTYARRKREICISVIEEFATNNLLSRDASDRSFGVLLLGYGVNPTANVFLSRVGFRAGSITPSYEALTGLRAREERAALARAVASREEAARYFYTYGEHAVDLLRAHGPNFLITDVPEWRYAGSSPILINIFVALGEEILGKIYGDREPYQIIGIIDELIAPIANGDKIEISVAPARLNRSHMDHDIFRSLDMLQYYFDREVKGKARRNSVVKIMLSAGVFSCVLSELYDLKLLRRDQKSRQSRFLDGFIGTLKVDGTSNAERELAQAMLQWRDGGRSLVRLVAS